MTPKKHEEPRWAKPAFILSQNIYVTALYRIIVGPLVILSFTLLAWLGNRVVTGQDTVLTKVDDVKTQLIELKGDVTALKGKTDTLGTDYANLYGTVNSNASDIAVLKSQQAARDYRGR